MDRLDPAPALTHVDASGAARMVDVTGKQITVREAVAAGTVRTTAAVIDLLREGAMPKGDALAVARLAGITGAKRTPDIVPLCHPIALHGVQVDLDLVEGGVDITTRVRTADRTGVEMEALTAVAAAGLALIDMIKAVDPAASLDHIRVLSKEGGASGRWLRAGEGGAPEIARASSPSSGPASGGSGTESSGPGDRDRTRRAQVIVASTRAAAGIYADTSGATVTAGLRELGFEVGEPEVVADGDAVEAALRRTIDRDFDVIITCGGTGLTPTDRTPEVTRALLDYEVPGIPEAIRAHSRTQVPTAALSRGVAGVIGQSLIINLPGSAGGARDSLAVLAPILAHAVDQLHGGDHVRIGSAS